MFCKEKENNLLDAPQVESMLNSISRPLSGFKFKFALALACSPSVHWRCSPLVRHIFTDLRRVHKHITSSCLCECATMALSAASISGSPWVEAVLCRLLYELCTSSSFLFVLSSSSSLHLTIFGRQSGQSASSSSLSFSSYTSPFVLMLIMASWWLLLRVCPLIDWLQ